jgi:preprotein translocase subunit YajC
MMNYLTLTLAQAGAPAADPFGMGQWGMLLPMVIIFAMLYFMMIRPQQRKEKERRKLIENIKSGERVMFSGGILGTVTNVKEGIFVVKIADNVKIEIARGAVIKVVEKGDKVEAEEDSK